MRRKSLLAGVFVGAASLSAGLIAFAQGQLAPPEAVETAQLAKDAFSTGTLTAAEGALEPGLWDGSDAETLEYLLLHAPARPVTPSIGLALRRILLSPGAAPAGAAPSLGGKKLLALARAGFVDEANTVASLSTAGRGDPWTGQALAISDLLKGDVARACERNANLSSGRDELFWVKLRVACYAAAGETDAADLTLNLLREQGALSASEETLLTATVTGVQPKTPPETETILEHALAKRLSLPIAPGLIDMAAGGVLSAIARDADADAQTRLAAAQRAVAMGVMAPNELSGLAGEISFDVAEISNAATAAQAEPNNPLTDALLYQSVKAMSAPEFLRDKAQRISLALGLGNGFARAYALSVLYAEEITSLEGAIVTPIEAERFAMARMAVGDAVGAGQWLLAMIGESGSLSALPEPQAMLFIDRVNLLAVLDPQTAAQVARTAGVSVLTAANAYDDGALTDGAAQTAHILRAAFDAATGGKVGQAGLAALAASAVTEERGSSNDVAAVNAVVVEEGLRIAGMSELMRRDKFERAWIASFPDAGDSPLTGEGEVGENANAQEGDDGLTPRLKPSPN